MVLVKDGVFGRLIEPGPGRQRDGQPAAAPDAKLTEHQGRQDQSSDVGDAPVLVKWTFRHEGGRFAEHGEGNLLIKLPAGHLLAPDSVSVVTTFKKELAKLYAATQQKGYSCVATKLYWKRHMVKCEIALGKGKKEFDKRATEKERDWNREKQRVMSHSQR